MVSTDRQTTKVIVVKPWCLQTDRQQNYYSEAMVSTDRQTDNKSYCSDAMVSTDRQTTKVIVVKPWCLQTDRQQKLLQWSHGVYRQTDNKRQQTHNIRLLIFCGHIKKSKECFKFMKKSNEIKWISPDQHVMWIYIRCSIIQKSIIVIIKG
jgi:hypothetical protein